jgi:hypothetical protein
MLETLSLQTTALIRRHPLHVKFILGDGTDQVTGEAIIIIAFLQLKMISFVPVANQRVFSLITFMNKITCHLVEI